MPSNDLYSLLASIFGNPDDEDEWGKLRRMYGGSLGMGEGGAFDDPSSTWKPTRGIGGGFSSYPTEDDYDPEYEQMLADQMSAQSNASQMGRSLMWDLNHGQITPTGMQALGNLPGLQGGLMGAASKTRSDIGAQEATSKYNASLADKFTGEQEGNRRKNYADLLQTMFKQGYGLGDETVQHLMKSGGFSPAGGSGQEYGNETPQMRNETVLKVLGQIVKAEGWTPRASALAKHAGVDMSEFGIFSIDDLRGLKPTGAIGKDTDTGQSQRLFKDDGGNTYIQVGGGKYKLIDVEEQEE